MIKVAIVDDRPINRQMLSENLLRTGHVAVSLVAVNGRDFLEKMAILNDTPHFPQIVLMDIEMPEMDGIEAVKLGKSQFPSVEFLMLTVFDDEEKIFQAIQSGAVGYLLKDEPVEFILEAMHEVLEMGGAPMSPTIARKTLKMMTLPAQKKQNPVSDSGLSVREREILQLVVEGLDYRRIGERLFISPHTARTHIGTIYKKLHITSKAQAINLAHQKGWF
jgi:DNA-binding NarL/FixJ family response regulator